MGRIDARRSVALVETAYRAATSRATNWLADVLVVAAPMLEAGGGVWAYEYDTRRPLSEWLSRPVVAVGDDALADGVLETFRNTPLEINTFVHQRAGAVTVLSELLGKLPTEHSDIGPHARDLDVGDMFGVNASDPTGSGVYFCAASPRAIAIDETTRERWGQLAAHLAAASRLRRVLATTALPDVVFSADGRVLHAAPKARAKIEGLKRAARSMDRARSRAQRADPEALASWRALVEGRWSLVDVVESDGQRYVLAHPNAPSVRDPRRLTSTERLIAAYVAMGHPNKLIAYEVGMAEGTVSTHVHAVLRKLGVRTRVELIDRVSLLRSGTTHEVAVGGEALAVVAPGARAAHPSLTDAELAVARLAARGLSNAEIARERGGSARTVANQLATVFAKLSVRSRSELALRM